MQRLRTFIAVDVPDSVRDALAEYQKYLKRPDADIKWVRPQSIHITLKFFGDVDSASVDEIGRSMAVGCEGVEPFRISIGGVGAFPNCHRPRVIWAGVSEGGGQLTALADRIDTQLSRLGFPREKRRFSAHLTLGRVKSPQGVQSVIDAMQKKPLDAGFFTTDEVILMKSDLQPTGAVYTVLRSYQLKG